MNLSDILTLVFGFIATILGILLKAEYEKRRILQQQVVENKRRAYSKFNEIINELFASAKEGKTIDKNIERFSKKMIELRQEIWQFGSDEVVRAYAVWNQCMFSDNQKENQAAFVLWADLIIKMRTDMGLSTKKSMTPLDILRIFVTDIEAKYDDYAKAAKKFRKQLLNTKHATV